MNGIEKEYIQNIVSSMDYNMGKVVAIDSIGGTNYFKKGHNYDPFLTDFIQGIPESIKSNWDVEENNDSTLIIRGLGGGSQKAIKKCWATGREFYAMDTGYLGNQKHKLYHRITRNALQKPGPIIDRSYDRLGILKYKFVPYKSGSKILVCPPSDKVMNFFNQGSAADWTAKIIEEIKKYTDRPIEIRMKPIRSERVTTKTIEQALSDDVHILVTYNSIAATEALMYGKPALTLGPNAAEVVCETKLENIENPRIPTKDETIAYFAHLSYAQFTQDEMANGYAWKVLQEDKARQ